MKNLLDTVSQPEAIQHFTQKELVQLAQECRERIIEVTSQRGGHLASSLGTLEITIALFKVFDFRSDRVVWDVGHQAYAHKLLSGRNKNFDTLSLKGGVKKFLSRDESAYDHFGAGHASTSISAALGMAIGRDLLKEKHHVIAVIGDGSLTGGLAFEGLNHNGYLEKDMIVILNDNGMGIDPNVGALSRMITHVASSSSYNRFKAKTWELAGKSSYAHTLRKGLRRIKASLKLFLTPGLFFDQLGWRYFGPVDGHNLQELVDLLEHVKKLKGPIVIHALTQKGKGYSFAENDAYKYHGVSPFVPESGEFIQSPSQETGQQSYSTVYGEKLEELMEKDSRVVAISAAMMSGTGIISLKKKFPDRVLDCGIAEGHAVTSAAGMATTGLKPFVTIYSTFMQRAFDHIIHDVALQRLPVRFMMDRGGLVGADGPTHHGVYDLSYMRMIPGMTILVPQNGTELRAMMDFAHHHESGPISIRYPRGNTDPNDKTKFPPIEMGKAHVIKKGNDIAFFAVGVMVENAKKAAELLEKQGLSVAVINARFVKPLDRQILRDYAAKVQLLVTLEDNTLLGGFGSGVLEELSQLKLSPQTLVFGVPDQFIEQGTLAEQQEDAGLSVDQIVTRVLNRMTPAPKQL
ncbi:1-deoxy-D-xylulose-5-phosphate synthase [Deltaproteobacteria bacterium TL4]